MSYRDLVEAAALLNGTFTLVGYAILATALRGRTPRVWLSYGGVALLVGASAVGVVCCGLAVAGLRIDLRLFALVAAVLSAAGVAAAWRLRLPPVDPPRASHPGRVASVVTAAACAGVVAVGLLLLANAFRSSPTLDDVWDFWIPRGIVLTHSGLDPKLFLPNRSFVSIQPYDYPLWWSTVLGLGVRLTGSVDVRFADVEGAVLVVAMLAASARLLAARVRAEVLWPCLLLIAVAPALHRQVLGGGADLPLAIYLSLFVLCAASWVGSGRLFELGLATIFGAAGLQVKSEGAPQLLLFGAVLAALAWRRGGRRPLLGLAAAVVGAFVSAAPFLVWRQVHGLRSNISLTRALDPSFLASQADRVDPTARSIGHQLVSPHDWFLIVPAIVVLGLAGALLERRVLWLAPAVLVLVGYAFWIWVYWSDTADLRERLDTTAYRVVDSVVLVVALALPVLADRLVFVTRPGSRMRAAPPG